jgi:adenylate cyclase
MSPQIATGPARSAESSVPAFRPPAGSLEQQARLYSGLVLFAFALTHFLNHALGLVSLETMHEVQQWRWLVTRSAVGTIVLGGALLVHIALGLYRLATRATFRMAPWELAQIALGIVIPFLLLPHIVNTRIARSFFGVNDNYLYELARLWPGSAFWQSVLLVAVWTHGCIGIHHWLKLDPRYRRVLPGLVFLAIAVPMLALGGFMVTGRAVAALADKPDALREIKDLTRWPAAGDQAALADYRLLVRIVFGALLAATAGVIAWRRYSQTSAPRVAITYVGGPTVSAPVGPSLLEISRMSKVPHATACGGRARCSTCRVRIEEGADKLPAPAFAEAFTLASIGAPPNVRLACQIRPQGPLTVTRLVREPLLAAGGLDHRDGDAVGAEKNLAIMMLDMREFTRMSQGRLPYDVVYVLNEFFAVAGSAIVSNGGWIDKFMGDGLLAVFGREQGVEVGSRQALCAARAIDLALDHVNAKLAGELGRPLRVGMGIHAGSCLIGRIGYGPSLDMTVIGNPVNIASRLEQLAKVNGFQIVVSKQVADHAGWAGYESQLMRVEVRGVVADMEVVGIARGRDLPASILAGPPADAAPARGRRA